VKLMTWNMQGAGTTGDPEKKWAVLGDWLVGEDDPPGVISLQECGTVPDKVSGRCEHVKDINQGGWPIEIYLWTAEDQSATFEKDYYLSYVDLGTGSNRVNLALLSVVEPIDGITTFNELRPALGIETSLRWYFCVHSSAARGWDTPDVLMNIFTSVTCGPWIAMGDWNSPPDQVPWNGEVVSQLKKNCGLHHVEPNLPTQPRVVPPGGQARVIDYAAFTNDTNVSRADRLDMGCSDHYAVVFS
jgi:hypothetical protein